MPEITKENRTVMYSLADNGEVIKHELPFNANEKTGMQILEGYIKKGYMFDDPRKKVNEPIIVGSLAELEKVLKKPVEVPEWGYFCTQCNKVHNRNSKLGKSHMIRGG